MKTLNGYFPPAVVNIPKGDGKTLSAEYYTVPRPHESWSHPANRYDSFTLNWKTGQTVQPLSRPAAGGAPREEHHAPRTRSHPRPGPSPGPRSRPRSRRAT